MKKLLITIGILAFTLSSYAQYSSSPIFTQGDRIQVNLGDQGINYYSHQVNKGHTIYSLSKAFNVSPSKIYAFNKLEEGSPISLGQILRIPISENSMYTETSLASQRTGHYIPVYYTVAPKDNLYRISKVYFNQPIESIKTRNNIIGTELSKGQDLLIGWLSLGKQPVDNEVATQLEEPQVSTDAPTIVDSITGLTVPDDSLAVLSHPQGFNITLLGTLTYTDKMTIVKKSEVAYWDKSMRDNGSVFALHSDATINSYIQLYNPLVKRSIRAKVIGRIPYGTYTNDVKLVLSPRAAIQLGGLDSRFRVETEILILK